MKTKFTLFLVSALLNLFAVTTVSATHAAGGEITYRWLGGNTYYILLTFYRDCAGPNAPTLEYANLQSSCGDNIGNIVASPIAGTGTVVSPCKGVITICNGGTAIGIQKWQYALTYTLPHQCTDWKISFTDNARNNATTTLFNPGGQSIYVEAHLNDSLFNHDSPVFTSDPELYYCIGTTYVVDCSAIDGCDSLVYSLIRPRTSSNTYATYLAAYDSLHFISSSPPLSLDAQTGLLTIHPTATEVGIGVVLVQQYRNGVLIGSIMRDAEFFTKNCINTPIYLPQISGINGTNQYSAIFPANKKTCFNLFSSDSDSTQSTYLSLGASLPGDTLIVDTMPHQSGTFCWMPLISDTGTCPHCFSIRVNDNFCPAGIRNYKYCISVVDSGYHLNLNDIDLKYIVIVSPNPFSKSATLSIHGTSPPLHAQFILFDALGRKVLNAVMDKNEMALDGTLLPKGIYFYSIREDDRMMAAGKIMIVE